MASPAVPDKRTIVERYLMENSEALAAGMAPKDIKKGIDDMLVAEGLPRFRTQLELRVMIEEMDGFVQSEAKAPPGIKTWKIRKLSDQDDYSLVANEFHIKMQITREESPTDIYALLSLYIVALPQWEKDFVGNIRLDPENYGLYIKNWLTNKSEIASCIASGIPVNIRTMNRIDIIKLFYEEHPQCKHFFLAPRFRFEVFEQVFTRVVRVITVNHPNIKAAIPLHKKLKLSIRAKAEEEAKREAERERLKQIEEEERMKQKCIKKEKRRQEQAEHERKHQALLDKMKQYMLVEQDATIDNCDMNTLERITRERDSEIRVLEYALNAIDSGMELNEYQLKAIIDLACRKYEVDPKSKEIGLYKYPYDNCDDDMSKYLRNRVIYNCIHAAVNRYRSSPYNDSEKLIKTYSVYDGELAAFYNEVPIDERNRLGVMRFKALKKQELLRKLLDISPNDAHLNRVSSALSMDESDPSVDIRAEVTNSIPDVPVDSLAYRYDRDTFIYNYYEKMNCSLTYSVIANDLHEYAEYATKYADLLSKQAKDDFHHLLMEDARRNSMSMRAFEQKQREKQLEVEFGEKHDGRLCEFTFQRGSTEYHLMHYDRSKHQMYYYPFKSNKLVRRDYEVRELFDESRWKDVDAITSEASADNMLILKATRNPTITEPNEELATRVPDIVSMVRGMSEREREALLIKLLMERI